VLRLRYGPWERFEVGLDVPWTSRFDGTLDPFIEAVETSLDQEVQARFELPQNDWTAIAVRDDGSRTLRMEGGNGIGDISLRGKYALVRQQELGFDAAVVASLGLPTGASTFGGEGVTPGLGVHAQWPPFETVNLFGGATVQYHSDATEQDFQLAPWRWMTYVGAEWRPGKSWFGLIAEYQIYGPLARVDDPLTDPSHYYAGGFRFYLPWRVTLETTVVENVGTIENRNSSDVSFHFAASWRFGAIPAPAQLRARIPPGTRGANPRSDPRGSPRARSAPVVRRSARCGSRRGSPRGSRSRRTGGADTRGRSRRRRRCSRTRRRSGSRRGGSGGW
jgi:hypothetical protein